MRSKIWRRIQSGSSPAGRAILAGRLDEEQRVQISEDTVETVVLCASDAHALVHPVYVRRCTCTTAVAAARASRVPSEWERADGTALAALDEERLRPSCVCTSCACLCTRSAPLVRVGAAGRKQRVEAVRGLLPVARRRCARAAQKRARQRTDELTHRTELPAACPAASHAALRLARLLRRTFARRRRTASPQPRGSARLARSIL